MNAPCLSKGVWKITRSSEKTDQKSGLRRIGIAFHREISNTIAVASIYLSDEKRLWMFDVVGTFLPVSIEEYRMYGSFIMVGLCNRPLVVSEDVYWWLVGRKFQNRLRSIDEVLRKEMPQMTGEIGEVQIRAVKRYTDEGPIYVNTIKQASKNRHK